MIPSTRPAKNQIGFHEKINLIDNASGNIYLDPQISSTHLIKPTANIGLFISAIPTEINIPNDCLIQLFVIIHPAVTGNTLTFDPAITWNYMPNLTITLTQNNDLAFHFFTYDSGATWKGLFSGSFGA